MSTRVGLGVPIELERSPMISMTARHPQRPLRTGKAPYQEPAVAGPLPLQPPSSRTPASPEVNLEQLTQQAVTLAHSHQVSPRHGRDRLLVQLDDNERILREVCQRLMQFAAERRVLSSRGRVAGRQLQPGYRADTIGPAGSPQGTPPRVAPPSRHRRRKSAASISFGVGTDHPSRRSARPGEPPAVLQRLPDRGAVEAGGTVGGLRHVAAGPDRKPLSSGDPCCSTAVRSGAGPCGGRTMSGKRRLTNSR